MKLQSSLYWFCENLHRSGRLTGVNKMMPWALSHTDKSIYLHVKGTLTAHNNRNQILQTYILPLSANVPKLKCTIVHYMLSVVGHPFVCWSWTFHILNFSQKLLNWIWQTYNWRRSNFVGTIIWKQGWPLWLQIFLDIFDFSSATAEYDLTKLDKKHIFNFLYNVCVFARPKNKNGIRNCQLSLWNHSITVYKTWSDVFVSDFIYQVCVFRAVRKKDRPV